MLGNPYGCGLTSTYGKVRIPGDWFVTAAQALAEVSVMTDPHERARAINNNDGIWQVLRTTLAALRQDKCWYCESDDSRSDRPIDHYRPKNAVAEDDAHGGYWWLAFAWDNFRYCCTFCNSRRVDREHGTSGGKHDHFPLWVDGVRATFNQCSPADLEREKPLLLDPCHPGDPALLWFDEDGKPVPNPPLCGAVGTFLHERVTTSIHFYHLDHFKIVDRRRQLYQIIKRKLDQAEDLLRRLQDHADMTARQALADTVEDVRKLLSPKQPYAATARCAVMALRASYSVAELVLHDV